MSNKGVKQPIVHFCGNSSIDVTGSMYLVKFKKYQILLDCGLIQQSDLLTNYRLNAEQIKKIKPREIHYCILTHCHIDHSGNIPSLFAKGCQAHVYVPKGSIPFLRLLWEDSMKIMQSDCLKLSRSKGIKASPFYTQEDIENTINRCIEIDFNEMHQIAPEISFKYLSAGHIIHAAQVYLELKEGSIIKRIGITGDIGGDTPRPYITPKEIMPFVNLLIGENTYNTPTRPNKTKDREKDIEKIETIINESNKVVFPCFALGRCQELLTVLYGMWENKRLPQDIKIYIDSPLAVKICNIYSKDNGWQRIMAWSNVKFISEYVESVPIQLSSEKCIILSPSGFLSGGRVVSHLKTVLPYPNNHIVFIGFSGENNLASLIKEGQKEVKIDGELIANNANITNLVSFSSHCSYEELIEYYCKCKCDKLALVHGLFLDKSKFAETVQTIFSKDGKATRVVCINEGGRVYI